MFTLATRPTTTRATRVPRCNASAHRSHAVALTQRASTATRARATWMSISRADWRMRSSSRTDCTADLRMDLLILSMARSNSFIAASYLAFCAGDGLELELRRSADMAAKT